MPHAFALTCALALALPSPGAAQEKRAPLTLRVVVHGLRNAKGHVRIGLYRDADSWAKPTRSVAKCVAPVRGHEASCLLEVPGAGRYAFAFLHDEDDDDAMTYGAFGLPAEGYGFSNDARMGLLPPGFERASFEFTVSTRREATVFYPL